VLEALVGDTSLALTGTAAPAGASLLTAAPASDSSTVSTRGEEASLLTGGNN
jgi:hypothetical protein